MSGSGGLYQRYRAGSLCSDQCRAVFVSSRRLVRVVSTDWKDIGGVFAFEGEEGRGKMCKVNYAIIVKEKMPQKFTIDLLLIIISATKFSF